MEKKIIWQCHNPECNAQYSEYVNGCPKCATGEPGGSHKVSILDEYHPGYMPLLKIGGEQLNLKVKDAVSDGYPQTPEMDLILRIVANWGNAIEMPKMEGWVKEYATGARWVKADQKPEHNVGVLVFIPGEDNHITSGMWDISNEWVLLDEYRTPEEEVTHWMELPLFPDGYKHDVISDDWVSALKAIAKEELAKKEKITKDDWISIDDQLPTEGGRYWCYVEEVNSLGVSHFQWNCFYHEKEKRWSDNFVSFNVKHWRPLPEPPKRKEAKP